MTATKTVEAPLSFAGVFEDSEPISVEDQFGVSITGSSGFFMLQKGEWRHHLYIDHYPTAADVRQALELLISANPTWGYAAEVAKELGHELAAPSFDGLVRRYQSYSNLTDAEYDKELNARGLFPWRHDWELDSEGNYDPSARYEVSDDGGRYGGGASDYTVWK